MRTTLHVDGSTLQVVVSQDALNALAKRLQEARKQQGELFISAFNQVQIKLVDVHNNTNTYEVYRDLTEQLAYIHSYQKGLASFIGEINDDAANVMRLFQNQEKAKQNFPSFLHELIEMIGALVIKKENLLTKRLQQKDQALDVDADAQPLLSAIEGEALKMQEISNMIDDLSCPLLCQKLPETVAYFNNLKAECKTFFDKSMKIFHAIEEGSSELVGLTQDYAKHQKQIEEESDMSCLVVDTLVAKVEELKKRYEQKKAAVTPSLAEAGKFSGTYKGMKREALPKEERADEVLRGRYSA